MHVSIRPLAGLAVCALLAAPTFAQHPIRCATPDRGPELGADVPGDCSYNLTNPLAQYAPGSTYSIPVVFHVIQRTNGVGNVTTTRINQQMAALNRDFLASGIQFTLAGVTRHENNTWYNDGGSYWNTIAWNTNTFLNVYTNSAGGALGYVPNLPQAGGLVGTKADRVVVLWSTVGDPAPYGFPYDKGRSLVHEVGHYLGLFHTFQGGCTNTYSTGDRIVDTNAEQSAHFGCAARTTCGSPDPIDNFMDYSDDRCMVRYTSEQFRRLRCTLTSWRPALYTIVRQAQVSSRQGEGNLDSFVAQPAVLGASFRGFVDLSQAGFNQAVVLAFTAAAQQRLPLGPTLLVDPSSAGTLLATAGIEPALVGFSVSLPPDPSLEGLRLFTQAVHFGGASGFALSNAQDVVFGF